MALTHATPQLLHNAILEMSLIPAYFNLMSREHSQVDLPLLRHMPIREAMSMEIYIHLSNILIRLPSSFDQLSIEQLYKKYRKPETVTITPRNNKDSLPANGPPKAVLPLYLGKRAEKFTLSEVGAGVLVTLEKHLSQPQTFSEVKTATHH
ncbi:hypothetical protein AJ80_07383 [Polytolypa hystricis UAMH7299]|uniref:Uncharacterized protein n=1 Tax=Polytolypa hystricis (strain UAMH7299) TaxID=1447883 RepID=A0A2B7XQA8_POLH7|nr:hypothetical protein AJ80_07383 [Polytolypa hystricis UAMH7299]